MSEIPNYLDIIKQVFEHKRKQFLKAEEELKQSHSSHNPAPLGALAILATQFYSEIRTTNDMLENALKFVFKQENDMDEMRKDFLNILHVTQFLTKQIDKTPDSLQQRIKELDKRIETLEKHKPTLESLEKQLNKTVEQQKSEDTTKRKFDFIK